MKSFALIDPAELADAIRPAAEAGSAAVIQTVLDVRWRLGGSPGRDDYRSGHIPGAMFIDLDADVSGPPGRGGRHPLPDLAVFRGAMRAAGVSVERPVVVYDYGDGMAAARLWWTLRWAGHPNVRVLDGGFAAWERAGQPIESDTPPCVRGDFTAVPGHLPVLDADGAAAFAQRGALFDARSPERYRGETEPIDPVAGHVPGAGNLPYADLVRADGTLREPGELRERMAAAGVPARGDVGAYCGSGVTAAHTVLAVATTGRPDPALYVGSWSEWITDPDHRIATGAENIGTGVEDAVGDTVRPKEGA